MIKVTISANEFLSASDANKIASTRPFSTLMLPCNVVSARDLAEASASSPAILATDSALSAAVYAEVIALSAAILEADSLASAAILAADSALSAAILAADSALSAANLAPASAVMSAFILVTTSVNESTAVISRLLIISFILPSTVEKLAPLAASSADIKPVTHSYVATSPDTCGAATLFIWLLPKSMSTKNFFLILIYLIYYLYLTKNKNIN